MKQIKLLIIPCFNLVDEARTNAFKTKLCCHDLEASQLDSDENVVSIIAGYSLNVPLIIPGYQLRMRKFGNRIRTFVSEFATFGGFDLPPNSDSEQKSPIRKKPITIMHPIEERDPLPLFLYGRRQE